VARPQFHRRSAWPDPSPRQIRPHDLYPAVSGTVARFRLMKLPALKGADFRKGKYQWAAIRYDAIPISIQNVTVSFISRVFISVSGLVRFTSSANGRESIMVETGGKKSSW
jgi:hypothetical protein